MAARGRAVGGRFALEWVAGLTGLDVATLVARAAASPPGADGLVVLPWLGGARAPWWRDDARPPRWSASSPSTVPAIWPAPPSRAWRGTWPGAWHAMDADRAPTGPVDALALAGEGAGVALWVEILTATTGRPATVRRSNRSSPRGRTAAAAGAALLTGPAIRVDWTLDRLDPVVDQATADPASVERYHANWPTPPTAPRAATLDLVSAQLEATVRSWSHRSGVIRLQVYRTRLGNVHRCTMPTGWPSSSIPIAPIWERSPTGCWAR